ncbi:hypothetical protein CI109_100363 [Kwoniella shandongensis]|uniref:Uncharacterized protein n=1 Tax=Kwoniella shandongensis TaxID=1734106 RepID=A0AAJ8LFJ1_9TREE
MESFLQQLSSLPQDLSTIPLPQIDDQEQAAFADAIRGLLTEDPSSSAAARHTVLQAASSIPPRAEFGNPAITWATEDDIVSSGRDAIVRYSSSALSEGVFSAKEWFQALYEASTQRPRLNDVLISWSKLNFDVSSSIGI